MEARERDRARERMRERGGRIERVRVRVARFFSFYTNAG